METFFNIRYEFDKTQVHESIKVRLEEHGSDYICVADGNILNMVNVDPVYKSTVNGGMFSICDSSYVPIFLKFIYGIKRSQYSGSDIFKDIISEGKYRMIFLGTRQTTLDSLKRELTKLNPNVSSMSFQELPFLSVEEFDYESIARKIKEDKADIIWIALGAPKQEKFMQCLKPYLSHGVMIAVGAAFNFYSGISNVRRAPDWMVKNHLEFGYRLFSEPKKQIKRCYSFLKSLPLIMLREYRKKKNLEFLPPKCL